MKYELNLKIDDSEKYIDDKAFESNSLITSVELGANTEHIGAGAFADCESLTSVNFKNAIIIDDKAFERCESLKKITIPSSVKYIGIGAFKDCKNLEEVEIEATDDLLIDEFAFADCSELKVFNISGSNYTIGKTTFYGTKVQI